MALLCPHFFRTAVIFKIVRSSFPLEAFFEAMPDKLPKPVGEFFQIRAEIRQIFYTLGDIILSSTKDTDETLNKF